MYQFIVSFTSIIIRTHTTIFACLFFSSYASLIRFSYKALIDHLIDIKKGNNAYLGNGIFAVNIKRKIKNLIKVDIMLKDLVEDVNWSFSAYNLCITLVTLIETTYSTVFLLFHHMTYFEMVLAPLWLIYVFALLGTCVLSARRTSKTASIRNDEERV